MMILSVVILFSCFVLAVVMEIFVFFMFPDDMGRTKMERIKCGAIVVCSCVALMAIILMFSFSFMLSVVYMSEF